MRKIHKRHDPGAAAYNAYCLASDDHIRTAPEWSALSDTEKESWRAAARAAIALHKHQNVQYEKLPIEMS